MMRAAIALAITAAVALGGCDRATRTKAAESDRLAVSDAWIRLAPVPSNPSAAYFILHGGQAEAQLIGVSSPQAARAEMHETMTGDHGMAMMTPLKQVAVPAGATLAFAPAGRHVMLFGLDPAATAGREVRLDFAFAGGRRLSALARVVRWVMTANKSGRPLSPGEIALAAGVFGDAIDYPRVRIYERKWWPLHLRNWIMAPTGDIWLHPGGPLVGIDFAKAGIGLQGLFIHEMTHVWQHQSGLCLLLRRHPFCRYGYRIEPGKRFERYGIEQQAEIVRDAFLAGIGAPRAPGRALTDYAALLPFTPLRAAG